MAEYKVIPVKDISPDPKQPRKFFDERSMIELQASIKANGVLQPVMVRPLGAKYMLVCGERRFKASVAAGLKEIPAVIRHLADDEALEVQITENLQRKDVHPMEEAIAFKALADKYTTEEIALRVGKYQKFVVKRIKLADLIPDLQEAYFQEKIESKSADMLCRLSPEDQKAVVKECFPNNWKTSREQIRTWQIERMCDNAVVQLDRAPFKTNDAKLYPEAGACTKCPFNTANQPLLFDDLKGRHCTKPSCYNIKVVRHEKKALEAIAADPSQVVIAGSYPDDSDKSKIAAAKELGINVLDGKMYETIYTEPDEKLMTYDEWEADNYDIDDYDDTEQEKAERKDEWKEEYATYVEGFNADRKEFEAAKKEGRIIEAYSLTGYNAGKTVLIELKSAGKAMVDAATGDAGDNAILEEIAGIEMREARNKELDAEKVHAAVQNLMETETEFLAEQPKRGWHLSQQEIVAAAVALYDAGGYAFQKWMQQALNVEANYHGLNASAIEKLKRLTELGLNDILRHFIMDKLPCQAASRFTSAKSCALHNVASEMYSAAVSEIELQQEEKAIKRQERVDARIKALRKKLSTPEPVEA